MQIHRSCVAAIVLGLATAGASAQPVPIGGEDWTPVPAGQLDGMRGGFTFGNGLAVSFGLERLVEVNGSMVALTSLRIPDLANMTKDQAQQAREALSSVNLIQIGHDNIYPGSMPGQMLGGTVIQNSLDDQVIRSQTVISATVNSLSMLKELAFQRSLAAVVAGAASPP